MTTKVRGNRPRKAETMHGWRIKEVRELRGMSQDELAAALRISTVQIWRWESGKAKPSAEYIIALAKALGVTADYLLGLTDDPAGHLQEAR